MSISVTIDSANKQSQVKNHRWWKWQKNRILSLYLGYWWLVFNRDHARMEQILGPYNVDFEVGGSIPPHTEFLLLLALVFLFFSLFDPFRLVFFYFLVCASSSASV